MWKRLLLVTIVSSSFDATRAKTSFPTPYNLSLKVASSGYSLRAVNAPFMIQAFTYSVREIITLKKA